MGKNNSADEVLRRVLKKAINEDGWEPEFMQDLEDIQPPPVKRIIGEKVSEPVSVAAEDEPEPEGVSSESIDGLGAPESTKASQASHSKESERKFVFRSRVSLRAAAMLLLCVLLGGGAMLLTDRGQAQADKQELEALPPTGEERLSVVSSQEMRTEAFAVDYTIEIEGNISEAKKFWPDLCIPQYIPEGYAFESLNIKKTGESFFAEYVYKSLEGDRLMVEQAEKRIGAESFFIEDVVVGEETELGTGYYLEDKELETNSYRFYFRDGSIEITVEGKAEKDVLKQIAEGMKN